MGRSFPGRGGWNFHFTGLGRPAFFALVAEFVHAPSVFFLPVFEMATDGNTHCHHFPETSR
jgi:hypothetical protein